MKYGEKVSVSSTTKIGAVEKKSKCTLGVSRQYKKDKNFSMFNEDVFVFTEWAGRDFYGCMRV